MDDVAAVKTFLTVPVAGTALLVSAGSLRAQASDTLSSNSLKVAPPPIPLFPPFPLPPLEEDRFGRPGRAEMELFFQKAVLEELWEE